MGADNKAGGKKGYGHINIDGREISYLIRHSARAKKITLKITLQSGLEVVIPKGLKAGSLNSSIAGKAGWIIAKLDYYEKLKEKSRYINKRGTALFMGREYCITEVIRHGAAPGVNLIDDRMLVTIPSDSPEMITAAIESWYRGQAAKILGERAKTISSSYNLVYNRIFIRDQKTRWGSCSDRKNLNFNWRIIMAPPQVIDYLVVHELAHLVEMNHSKNFWQLVESICPDYKNHRRWLKVNGITLTI